MSTAVKRAKQAIFGAMRWSGAFSLIRNSHWRKQKLLILAYHGMSLDDEHIWDPALYMPEALFRERMEILRSSDCNILPLHTALQKLSSGDLPPRSVVLTFDDGFRDFLLKAVPVLEEYGYPATVYLTTYYSIRRYPVFNVFLRYLLWKARERNIDLSGVIPDAGTVSLATEDQRSAVWQSIAGHINEFTNDEKMEFSRRLSGRAGIDFDRLYDLGVIQIMSPSEVAEAVRRGFSVQLHTHRHRTPATEEEFRREVRENREHITRMCSSSVPPVHFCYPSGAFRRELPQWLRAEGVVSGTTCRTGLAGRADSPFALPRLIDTCTITNLEFQAWAAGAAHLLPRRS